MDSNGENPRKPTRKSGKRKCACRVCKRYGTEYSITLMHMHNILEYIVSALLNCSNNVEAKLGYKVVGRRRFLINPEFLTTLRNIYRMMRNYIMRFN